LSNLGTTNGYLLRPGSIKCYIV